MVKLFFSNSKTLYYRSVYGVASVSSCLLFYSELNIQHSQNYSADIFCTKFSGLDCVVNVKTANVTDRHSLVGTD